MVMCKKVSKYEEIREQRMEENKKRMEQLHLPILTQALKFASSPKPSLMKKTTPRVAKKELVPVRRSLRFSNKDVPQYKEVTTYERVQLPRTGRISYRTRNVSNQVYASDEARERAIEKANELVRELGSDSLAFVRSLLPSHVSGGFWLGLSASMSRGLLPKSDGEITLVDEEGEKWPVIHLAKKGGLSGGWRKFSVDHDLVDGDALVFQLIGSKVFKVFIMRVGSSGETGDDEMSDVVEPEAD